MRILTSALLVASSLAATAAPALATECGQHIAAIERRMQSAGASKVTGKPMNPDATSQASNDQHMAPPAENPSQKPSAEKMKEAQALIDKAKTQDKAGDKEACERTMTEATSKMGAVP